MKLFSICVFRKYLSSFMFTSQLHAKKYYKERRMWDLIFLQLIYRYGFDRAHIKG